mmetsp:Transcript_17622/g.25346  ORF Transcript_17622/g.25346 Transcript_17622/m.25346 type:complete len:88 (-) Transcript_17622:144-407(-)
MAVIQALWFEVSRIISGIIVSLAEWSEKFRRRVSESYPAEEIKGIEPHRFKATGSEAESSQDKSQRKIEGRRLFWYKLRHRRLYPCV